MKKVPILIICLVVFLIAGCSSQHPGGSTSAQPDKIVIQAPPAPPTAPLLKMIENKPFGDETALELVYYKTVEEATARIINGEADLTVLPVNVAAKLYNKKVNISLANISTWGILYLLSSDNTVKEWSDLKGKEIYVGAQGASPDIITRYLMQENNLSPEEMTIKYANSPEIAQMMIQGIATTAVLPEPQVTLVLNKNQNVQVIKDFYKEWQLSEGENVSLPQAGMVVQNKFAAEYPEFLAKFQQAYSAAIKQTTADPTSVSGLVQEEFGIPASVFEKSMTRTNINFADAQTAKTDVNTYLSKLMQFSPDMVGGKVPDEKFYLAE